VAKVGTSNSDRTISLRLQCVIRKHIVILKSIFKKWDGEAWTGMLWLMIGIGGGKL
jgi:hypothetical protein